MDRPGLILPSLARGLSARLLVLTVFFVMLSEVLIYVPSIARFRLVYLQERLAAAELASLSLKASADYIVTKELRDELFASSDLMGIVVKRPEFRTLMLGLDMPKDIDAAFDLRGASAMVLIMDAFEVLLARPRTIRVAGPLPQGGDGFIEVVMNEKAMRAAMIAYSTNILQLSIVISLLTAALVYFSLHVLMVRPMRRLTASMLRFRKEPENLANSITPSRRTDEIGAAEEELAQMQVDLRQALRQKAHLAALGTAVSKINHDLRNILATAQLVSDRLVASADPEVQRLAPTLIASIDRAIAICGQTLSYGRAEEPAPKRSQFQLADLIDNVALFLRLPEDGSIVWLNSVARSHTINADWDQMFRVVLNLGRNAVNAMRGGQGGCIEVTASRTAEGVVVEISDDGPGLPEKAREHLFEPFTGAAGQGGTGLGLAIARELVRAHDGDIHLVSSGDDGTVFRLVLPDPVMMQAAK